MKRKADIYKGFGIDYRPTNGGQVLAPWGQWVPLPLKHGTNTKLGPDAFSFSIYHGNETITADQAGPKTAAAMRAAGIESIQGSCPCHCKGCYCDAGNYRYDSTKRSLVTWLIAARYHIDFLERVITAQILADGVKQLRVHAAGDFLGREYAGMWARIAARFHGVQFWTYTKNDDAVQILAGLENLPVVPSITPAGINFGTCRQVLDMYAKLTAQGYRVHICACGTSLERHCCECSHGCKAIGTECDYVLFIMHSVAGYTAGKHDAAEFSRVLAIIQGQEN